MVLANPMCKRCLSDVIGSICSIWGISLDMIIRAVISLLWREHARRTLTEQFQGPLAAILDLTGDKEDLNEEQRAIAEMQTVKAIASMLTIANDAQLEGRRWGYRCEESR